MIKFENWETEIDFYSDFRQKIMVFYDGFFALQLKFKTKFAKYESGYGKMESTIVYVRIFG